MLVAMHHATPRVNACIGRLSGTWKKLAMTVKAQMETTTSMAALVRPNRAANLLHKWSSHVPEEQKIRVRIPTGCKIF
jgi:hypothetical protein